jgi:lipopolysaccharide export system permease protein
MPILWRYLLRSYIQVFLLCVTGFITVLLVIRFKDIAEFAILQADSRSILLFTLYQIPYILPNAIPISCVIASMLLFQRMSQAHELTALRAAGLGLKTILYPLMLAGIILSLANFIVVSELAPRCKFLAKELTYKMTASNPFYLINKISDGKLKNAYIDMRALRGGKKAKDVLLITNNRSNGRLGLATAKELTIDGELLTGKDVSIISSVDSNNREAFDHLVIENQTTMSTKASNLSQLFQDTDWGLSMEYLPLRMVLAKANPKKKNIWLDSAGLEIGRRLSISLTPFFFTLLGAAFGMEVGRNRTKKGIIWVIALTALYLSCFVGAKSMVKHAPISAWATYFGVYPIILLMSLRSLKFFSRGIE